MFDVEEASRNDPRDRAPRPRSATALRDRAPRPRSAIYPARYGFVRFSWPKVVSSPCPGCTCVGSSSG